MNKAIHIPRHTTNFRSNGNRGFTLLEILIAIVIFGILITTVYGALRAVLSKNDAISYGADMDEMARICMSRIIMDLNSIYVDLPPMYKQPELDTPPDIYRFVAEKVTVGTKYYTKVRFTSMAHLPMTGNTVNGIAEIVYYVMENKDPDKSPVLKRSDRVYPFFENEDFEERESDPTLCKDIDELKFTFYDEDGNEYDEWDSTSDVYKYATPRMIGILLKLKKNSEIYTFYSKVVLPVYREKIK